MPKPESKNACTLNDAAGVVEYAQYTDVVVVDNQLVAAYPLSEVTGVALDLNVANGKDLETSDHLRHFGERTTLFDGKIDPMEFNVKTHAVLRLNHVRLPCHVTSFRQVCIDMAYYVSQTPADTTVFQFEYDGRVMGDLKSIQTWRKVYDEFRKQAATWESEPMAVWIVKTHTPGFSVL